MAARRNSFVPRTPDAGEPDPWSDIEHQILLNDAALSATRPPSRSLRAGGVVFASTIGNALGVTPAVIAVFGDFLVPIAAEFQWSRAAVSGALALVSVATALASPLAGRIADAIGARKTVLIGSAALAASIISLLLARPNAVLFYAQFGVIGVAGAVAGNMVYAKLLSEWFEARRGLWIGVAGGVGNGMGATFLPVLAALLLPVVGWRASFGAIGAVVLVGGWPIQYFLIKNAPVRGTTSALEHAVPAELEGVSASTALRSREFWLLATSLPIGGGCLVALFTTIVPLLTDRGFSLEIATGVIVACSLTAMVWEPTVGFLLDHTAKPRGLAPLYLVAAAALLIILTTTSPLMLIAGGVMLGLGLGAEGSALYFLLSRYFGRRAIGTISGVATGIWLGTGALATVLLNAVYDGGKSYRIAVLYILPLLVWNSAAVLFLGRYPFNARTDAPTPAG